MDDNTNSTVNDSTKDLMSGVELDQSTVLSIVEVLRGKDNIVFAGLFGSRVSDKEVSDDSDIDLAVILRDYSRQAFSDLHFELTRRVSEDIDLVSLNKCIDHGQKLDHSDELFRDRVMSNIFILKDERSGDE